MGAIKVASTLALVLVRALGLALVLVPMTAPPVVVSSGCG
jgi:hypothetical protein